MCDFEPGVCVKDEGPKKRAIVRLVTDSMNRSYITIGLKCKNA